MSWTRLALVLVLVSALTSVAFAASAQVTRSFEAAVVGSQFTVTLTVTPDSNLSQFSLVDFLPAGWSVSSWDVSGFDKAAITTDDQVRSYQDKSRHAYSWEFKKAFSSPVTLTYKTTAPMTAGSYEFIALWVYPGGFNQATEILPVAAVSPPHKPPAQLPPPSAPAAAPAQSREGLPWIPIVLGVLVVAAAVYWFVLRKPGT